MANEIGYPVMVRIAFALGGLGSGMCRDETELVQRVTQGLAHSPQILIEEYLTGWQEFEYEVVRDRFDNCITVCNMENFDPLGIHTGESIVVAPSQTLTNEEYHSLRDISIRVIRHLKVVGECNIQFALDPSSDAYRVIEVNARLSRSSALASKATGYPLAYVAAKLALGHGLTDLMNSVTRTTTACFEPALDYVVVKVPRWDLKKFRNVATQIGTAMKSVGEVMAIGRNFEEALQKALRMLEIGVDGLVATKTPRFDDIDEALSTLAPERVFAIPQALRQGSTVDDVHRLTHIDRWFLQRIRNIAEVERALEAYAGGPCPRGLLAEAKKTGFSDGQIGHVLKTDEDGVRRLRATYGIHPCVKQVDTLAAEYPAKTNYLYLTYDGQEDDVQCDSDRNVLLLGSGAYRIGSSVEFDWCCVNASQTLRALGYRSVLVNYNPETVSTDYDVCDRLYFDSLTVETVLDIYERERCLGVVVVSGRADPEHASSATTRARREDSGHLAGGHRPRRGPPQVLLAARPDRRRPAPMERGDLTGGSGRIRRAHRLPRTDPSLLRPERRRHGRSRHGAGAASVPRKSRRRLAPAPGRDLEIYGERKGDRGGRGGSQRQDRRDGRP